jgi:hypothetical protein
MARGGPGEASAGVEEVLAQLDAAIVELREGPRAGDE